MRKTKIKVVAIEKGQQFWEQKIKQADLEVSQVILQKRQNDIKLGKDKCIHGCEIKGEREDTNHEL